MVAETQAAVPTATPVPPTETASPTLPPTSTPLPLPTSGTPGSVPTGAPTTSTTLSASFTQQAPPTQSQPTSSSGGGGTQDVLQSASHCLAGTHGKFQHYQPDAAGRDDRSIHVCGDRPGSVRVSHHYRRQLLRTRLGIIALERLSPANKTSKHSARFRITEGNWSIVVKNDSIEARGGCYPNC